METTATVKCVEDHLQTLHKDEGGKCSAADNKTLYSSEDDKVQKGTASTNGKCASEEHQEGAMPKKKACS